MAKRRDYYADVEDIELPSKRKSSSNSRKRKKKNKKKKLIIIIIIEIILILAFIAFFFIKGKFDKINKYDLDKDNLNVTDLGLKDYYNIAVFGIDARDNELEKNTRSDSIMLLSINTKTDDVKITSFYRDTCVYVEGHDYTKLCHAYAYGGPELAISTLNDNFDLDITDFVTLNFTAVADAINLLGGVEVDVTEKEVASVNKYGKEVARVSNGEFTPIKGAGKQTLDGYQAVGYSRIRKIDSDFNRANRQRTVVSAMLDKMKKSDLSTINNICDEILPKILTNLETGQILSLLKDAMSYNISDSEGFPYEKTTGYIGKGSYVFPVDLSKNVVDLHKKLFDTDKYEPTEDVKKYSSYISQYTK